MSSEMSSIKRALIAALCEHPDAEKYRQQAFAGEQLEKTIEAMARETLTKADFFSAVTAEGNLIIDTPGAWKNFSKIIAKIHQSGERLTFDDCMTPLGQEKKKTLLEMAVAANAMDKIFTFEIWRGRFDEMRRVWYRAPLLQRRELMKNKGPESLAFKRQMYAAENKVPPEDRLMRANVTPEAVRQAFGAKGNFDELVQRLAAANDWLRKEYVMLPDEDGDTVFDNRPETWSRYPKLVEIMAAHGERFDVADFTQQVSYAKCILSRAAEHSALAKVFTPAHWKDRLDDMRMLWSCVLPAWKAVMSDREFDAVYAEAESLTYTPKFSTIAFSGKSDLTDPLNDGDRPVRALGLKAVWDKIDEIRFLLNGHGEKISASDLRLTSGAAGETCLMAATKYGYFNKVLDICLAEKTPLAPQDFLMRDARGTTLIDLLAERSQLALVFSPPLWAGRIDDMKTLWAQVPIMYRNQIDFAQVVVAVQQETLRAKKPPPLRRSKP